ncbi:hypothetical protein [Novipirellula maiorica]|uniref:hypothetical protein n=1 Tax=Novipirellula maiorica TaxID=1265734 RepID=UPI00034C483A|nr:hypothetical protein [Rhodopirellula maiorica]
MRLSTVRGAFITGSVLWLVVLIGCGGPDNSNSSPEVDELQQFLSEHPDIDNPEDEGPP